MPTNIENYQESTPNSLLQAYVNRGTVRPLVGYNKPGERQMNGEEKLIPDLSTEQKLSPLEILAEKITKVRAALSDSLLGSGHFVARLSRGRLLQKIAPALKVIKSSLGRSLGGLTSTIIGSARIVNAARSDLKSGDSSLKSARKELTVTLGGAAAGLLVGEAGYLIGGAALGLSAPVSVTTALAIGTFIGTGYAAYQARNYIASQWNKVYE